MKTRFSFEVQLPAPADGTQAAASDGVMTTLAPSLQALFAAEDPSATVSTSDSHKGSGHQLVELVSTLADAQIEKILAGFSTRHGLVINALE